MKIADPEAKPLLEAVGRAERRHNTHQGYTAFAIDPAANVREAK